MLPATGGGWISYYAMVTAPAENLRGDYFVSSVWNAAGDALGGQIDEWYWATYDSKEVDVSFYYTPGTGTPVAGYFSDRAEGRTPTFYGVDGVASVMLTYRKGLSTSIQGPAAPTPGTNVTWSVAAQNASGPYSYRWFKDGSELTDQTSSSLTLPVTTDYFVLGAITQSQADGADTLAMTIVPNWQVTISGMSERSPDLATSCGYTSDTGTNPSSSFGYQWYLDGTRLAGNEWTTNPTFSLGSHILELNVTDDNGYTARANMSIDVTTDGPSSCM